jgi:hypothetical protein
MLIIPSLSCLPVSPFCGLDIASSLHLAIITPLVFDVLAASSVYLTKYTSVQMD